MVLRVASQTGYSMIKRIAKVPLIVTTTYMDHDLKIQKKLINDLRRRVIVN